MMKKYKWSLLLGSLLSLSPILIGLLLWNQLPAKLPTHFSTGNTPDGWSSKAITVFGLPLFMFAMMWFCFLFTHVDPKRQADPGTCVVYGCTFPDCCVLQLCYCSWNKCEYYSAHLSDHWTHAFGNWQLSGKNKTELQCWHSDSMDTVQ